MTEIALWLTTLLRQSGGPELQANVLNGLTWADVLASLIFLLLAGVVSGVLASILKRKSVKLHEGGPTSDWFSRIIQAVGRPLSALIWISGIYLAAVPLLAHLSTPDAVHPLRRFVDRMVDLGLLVSLFWLFYRLTRLLEQWLAFWSVAAGSKLGVQLVPFLGKSLRVIVPVMATILALPLVGLPPTFSGFLSKASSILIVAAVAYTLFQCVAAAEKWVLTEYDVALADNLQARKVQTQVQVLSRTLHVLISIFTIASILMLFEDVRRLGTSILASAGVMGIIIGFAAQRTIANLFAGFQLALTQPIRMDDVVIIESEWGRIEEITLTYVVVRIWDERRLIVPLSYFLEKPFQNWTRVSSDLLGSVFIFADYSLPLESVRTEVQRIVENSALWDRKFWNLQITDTTERSMQMRILATAADSGKAWDLRCEIREKLLVYVQRNYPQSLPKLRTLYDHAPTDGAPASVNAPFARGINP